MQATFAPPTDVARDLLTLWQHIMRADSGRRLYGLFEELDLSLTQLKALHALSAAEEDLTVNDVADRLGLSLPGASRAIDGLHARGWLERRADDRDRRCRRIRVTAAGRDVVERVDSARLVGVADFTASLDPADRSRLATALTPILEKL